MGKRMTAYYPSEKVRNSVPLDDLDHLFNDSSSDLGEVLAKRHLQMVKDAVKEWANAPTKTGKKPKTSGRNRGN